MRYDDDTAWNGLWRDWAPRLLSYLSAFGGLGPEDRQDIVHRAFIKAWEARARLAVGPQLLGWLIRASRNQALDLLKARRREGERFPRAGQGEDGIDPPGRFPGPEESALEAEKGAFMERFLAGLTHQERELSHLCYAEGFTYPEIARATGIPLGTVKWRAARLRSKLEAAYQKEFGEC